MTKTKEKIGGYWIKNNGMTREVVYIGRREVVLESAAHGDRTGPDGVKGVRREGGDLLYVPKGERGLDRVARATSSLMKYSGPLVGQFAHVQIGDEVRLSCRKLTAEHVDKLPLEMLTRVEKERRGENESSDDANARKGRK